MEQRLIRKTLQIEGMTCTSCEMRIENALKKLEGVVDVRATLSSSSVYVTYDANVVSLDKIIETIEKLHYQVKNKAEEQAVSGPDTKKASEDKMTVNQFLGIGIILFALYFIIKNTKEHRWL